MGKYKIAGVTLEFNFLFDDYFKGRIEKYEISKDSVCQYKINTYVKNKLTEINSTNYHQSGNKKIYDLGNEEIVCIYNKENMINIKTKYDKNYHNIDIYFHKRIDNKLAEYEYIITGLFFFEIALKHQLIPIHASAIKFKNEGLIFSAPSTTGKSTHANLWKQIFNDIVVINDDKPLIKYFNNKFYVIGTPWSGKSTLNENIMIPLKAIIFLKQSKNNKIQILNNNEKLTYFLRNIYRPIYKKQVEEVLNNIDSIIKHIPIYLLHCNVSENAVWTIYNKLYK